MLIDLPRAGLQETYLPHEVIECHDWTSQEERWIHQICNVVFEVVHFYIKTCRRPLPVVHLCARFRLHEIRILSDVVRGM